MLCILCSGTEDLDLYVNSANPSTSVPLESDLTAPPPYDDVVKLKYYMEERSKFKCFQNKQS